MRYDITFMVKKSHTETLFHYTVKFNMYKIPGSDHLSKIEILSVFKTCNGICNQYKFHFYNEMDGFYKFILTVKVHNKFAVKLRHQKRMWRVRGFL